MNNMFNKLITFLVPFLPKIFVRLFSNKYIAGINQDEALKIIKRLNDKNLLATIDILGEHTKSINEANLITNEYVSLYKKIKSKNLNCNISIKPSHIGADISEDLFLKNLEKIHSHSISCDNFLRIDMEDSSFTNLTINAFNQRYKIKNNIGIVIQAYLKRSHNDIIKLKEKTNIRLCKGIYNESKQVAIKNPIEINKNYIALLKTAIKQGLFVGIATHDPKLIDDIIEYIEDENINNTQFEFQFLYGVPLGNMLHKIKNKNFNIRIYTPFGKNWYEYSIRRLKENPNISGYIIKNIFKKNFYK
ncbi:MAG: proline dehydrogenase [Candidatus Marinimicrobia bacterium]|nr:proline dehydrogenase [Candidatus Neomarinimicrobiota bacterium]